MDPGMGIDSLDVGALGRFYPNEICGATRGTTERLERMNMLEIKNLHVRIAEEETEIIKGLNLSVASGEVAAIMGPNGSGKSTLSYVLAGKDDYEVTEGDILFNGESILDMEPEPCAKCSCKEHYQRLGSEFKNFL